MKIGISRKELHATNGLYDTVTEGFLDRYKDFIEFPAPQQLQFAKDMFNLIATDVDTSKVAVIPGRCGIAKSTFIRSLASYYSTYDHFEYREDAAIGIIIVTDQLERLAEYQEKPHHVQSIWGDEKNIKSMEKYSTYISSDSKVKSAIQLLIESQYKPTVLLSTQRYFSMPDEQREMLFEYYYVDCKKQKIKQKREILIFDEKPYFTDTLKIEVRNFNDCSTALQNGIPENSKNREDKDWILKEYRLFRSKMENLLREKEKTSVNADYFYWREKDTTDITSDDKRFFELLEKHKTAIAKEYQNALTDLRAFKLLMTDGAFFITKKKNKHQEYETYFELYRDNRNKFYLNQNKIKCFVFDATSDIDPDYPTDYIHMVNCNQYNIPLNLKINLLDVPSSKSQIVNGDNAESQICAIYKTIRSYCFQQGFGNTLIVTYMTIKDKFKSSDFDVLYFGNIKGSNEFCNYTKFAHVGNNRFDPFAYFIKLIAKNPKVLDSLKMQNEEKSREHINATMKMANGLFHSSDMNNIMFRSISADFEQNIFRTAIRNFNNTAQVVVYVFWNCKTFETLNNMIIARYEPFKVEFQYMGVPLETQKAKTENRKSKNGTQTNSQKILHWYEERKKGDVFKLSEMLDELKITNDDLKNAKKNKVVSLILKDSRTKKQGYYKVI